MYGQYFSIDNLILISKNQSKMPAKKKGAGDADKGAKVFKNLCAICHSMSANGTGPKLAGVVGRAVASADGFSYS